MEKITSFLHWVISISNLLVAVILVIGFVISIIGFIVGIVKSKGDLRSSHFLTNLRLELGGYILYALELLIVVDVIESIITPELQKLIHLSIIVVIRVALSHFLNKEMLELEEKAEHSKDVSSK